MLKNIFLTTSTGLLLALAWPTYGWSLLVFLSFVPLLFVEHQIRNAGVKYQGIKVFGFAYWAFLIWNSITTWWIWKATPFGGVFAIVVNTLLMALVFFSYHKLAKRLTPPLALTFFIAIWISFEKFHHHWDFSWPWLSLGNVFSENIHWIQWYEITGIFGGSLWILMVNAVLFSAVVKYQSIKDKKLLFRTLALALSLVVLGISVSLWRWQTYQEKGTVVTSVVLQPNTDPYSEKYHQSSEHIAEDLINLALPKMDHQVSFVLAPETVFSNRQTLAEFQGTPAYQSLLHFNQQFPQSAWLTGIDLYTIYPSSIPKSATANKFSNSDAAWYESYNAAIFQYQNQKPEVYYKSKLVVGVELFPYRSVIEPLLGNALIDLGGSVSSLTTQKEVSVFENPTNHIKIAPIICYESIYGAHVIRYVRNGAQVLGVVTNDSWWGNTQGHQQLLSYARLRAIENRRSIVRSANSGISAYINQKGEINSSLSYETKGALKGTVKANDTFTFYSKYGDFVARISYLVAGLLFLVGVFNSKIGK